IEEFASGFGPTRFMTIDPTGTLLVSTPGRGRVVALPDRNRDGRADTVVTVAEGLELPHGLAFKDGQPYVAETGRCRRFRYDPAVKDGAFYGWPDCFAVGGRAVVDRGANGNAERCGRMTLPTIEIQGHSAPLGLAFYTGAEFPPAYRGSLFVAYHGSWNRSVPTGYKVVRGPFKGGRP